MIKYLIRKFSKKRRNDVSLFIYGKFICLLLFYKLINRISGLKVKNKSCLILFPPSLGLGDLIILSRIIDIVKSSKNYKLIKVFNSAPYLQKTDKSVSFINFKNIKEIVSFENFIFPSPSLLNLLIYKILGPSKCKGYINTNYVNFLEFKPYKINEYDPYYFRLKPFKYLFKYQKTIKPYVWSKEDREKLLLRKLNYSLKNVCKSKTQDDFYLILSTYNFYSKFRPEYLDILNQIKKQTKNLNKFYIVILGAKAKKEIYYNKDLAAYLKNNLINAEIINITGELSISSALKIIAQASFYIGANNGLANIAQMLGVKSKLLFNGPEKAIKRKFSKFTKIISKN